MDIEQTRQSLANICLTTEGADRLQRKVFNMLINEIRALRDQDFSFEQISELLKESGLLLRPSIVKNYFYEYLVTYHEGILERIEELFTQIQSISSSQKVESEQLVEAGQVHGLRCLPLDACIKPLPQRVGVPEIVYEDGLMEHPAIPGLMLSKDERLYGALLEIDENGKIWMESVQDKSFRIKWKMPIPRTETVTGQSFVEMNNDLFKYVGKGGPPPFP